MSKLMNSLHTRKWWVKTSDKQSEDMYDMLQNLYIQLIAIDNAISTKEPKVEYDTYGKKVTVKTIVKNDCPETERWKGKF